MFSVEIKFRGMIFDDSESNDFGKDSLLCWALTIEFMNGFELDVKCKLCLVQILRMGLVRLKDG